MLLHPDRKMGVMAILAGYKPKTERTGQSIDYPGQPGEEKDMEADKAEMYAAMKAFIAAVHTNDIEQACEAFYMLDQITDEKQMAEHTSEI